MSQPLTCDVERSSAHAADVLVSQLATGDTLAACYPHYVELCRAIVRGFDATVSTTAESDAPESAANEDAAIAEADEAAIARLEGRPASRERWLDQVDPELAPARVVRAGESSRARAARAKRRKAERERRGAVSGQMPTAASGEPILDEGSAEPAPTASDAAGSDGPAGEA